MEKSIPVIAGMVWYHREDYDACLRIMTDSDKLPRSFSVWLSKAEYGEQKLKLDGYAVVRAYIDPKTFPDWCRSRGLDINSNARTEYANFIAKESIGSSY